MLKRLASPQNFREKAWFRWPLVWLLASNIAVLVGCLAQWGVFDTVEHKTYDWRLQQRGVQPLRSRIVIIDIDTPSLNSPALNKPMVLWGGTHAKVLRILNQAGAKAIGFDIIPSLNLSQIIEKGSADGNPDQVLAQAISETPQLVMVFKRELLSDGSSKDLLPNELLSTALALGGGSTGFDKATFDSDAIVRRFTLQDIDGSISFPLALASKVTGQEPVFKNGEVLLGSKHIPLGAKDDGLISYIGPDGTFPRISYKDLLAHPQQYRSTLKDSICLIGFTSEQTQDLQSVPLAKFIDGNRRNLMAGVEIHANVLHSLLFGPYIWSSSLALTWALIGLATLTAVPLAWRPPTIWVVPILLAGLFLWVDFCLLAFIRWNLNLPLVAVALALALSQIAATATRLWQENQGKKWIEDVMGRRVSPIMLEHLRLTPDALELGGHRREVTVLFSDIRSFTQLSENLSPEQVTRFLNDYLNEMVEIIFAPGHDGYLDKFIGDGIMVIYNYPFDQKDHALRALRTAVAMQQNVEASQQRWRDMGMPPIEIGVGIHTGPAVLGSIGSARRMEQTAIGDTVNVASRIEGLCKTLGKSLGSGILLSETTYNAAKVMQLEEVIPLKIVPAAETELRGRREGLQLFAVCQEREHETEAGHET